MSTQVISPEPNFSYVGSEPGQQLINPPNLLNEVSSEVQQKIDLIDAILQAPDKRTRREAILHAAETLGKTTRTIRLMMEGCDLNLMVLGSNRKAILVELIPELIPSS